MRQLKINQTRNPKKLMASYLIAALIFNQAVYAEVTLVQDGPAPVRSIDPALAAAGATAENQTTPIPNPNDIQGPLSLANVPQSQSVVSAPAETHYELVKTTSIDSPDKHFNAVLNIYNVTVPPSSGNPYPTNYPQWDVVLTDTQTHTSITHQVARSMRTLSEIAVTNEGIYLLGQQRSNNYLEFVTFENFFSQTNVQYRYPVYTAGNIAGTTLDLVDDRPGFIDNTDVGTGITKRYNMKTGEVVRIATLVRSNRVYSPNNRYAVSQKTYDVFIPVSSEAHEPRSYRQWDIQVEDSQTLTTSKTFQAAREMRTLSEIAVTNDGVYLQGQQRSNNYLEFVTFENFFTQTSILYHNVNTVGNIVWATLDLVDSQPGFIDITMAGSNITKRIDMRTGKIVQQQTVSYDAEGRKERVITDTFQPDGVTLLRRHGINFNPATGLKINELITDYDANGKITRTYATTYQADGVTLSYVYDVRYTGGGLLITNAYATNYDAQGKKTRDLIVGYQPDGKTFSVVQEIFYNTATGIKTKDGYAYYNTNGQRTRYTLTTYQADGKTLAQIWETLYTTAGLPLRAIISSFDVQGRKTREAMTSFHADGKTAALVDDSVYDPATGLKTIEYYTYANAQGRKTQLSSAFYQADGVTLARMNYLFYDTASGKLTTGTSINYDLQGRQISASIGTYGSDGTLTRSVETKYDPVTGKIIKQTTTCYNTKGTVVVCS